MCAPCHKKTNPITRSINVSVAEIYCYRNRILKYLYSYLNNKYAHFTLDISVFILLDILNTNKTEVISISRLRPMCPSDLICKTVNLTETPEANVYGALMKVKQWLIYH